ncbi:MAG: putative hemolysin [Wohlfahrtiimonas sp.]
MYKALFILSCTVVLSGCLSSQNDESQVGMANPASTYCIEQGGESILKMSKSGDQYGVCHFSNGREIEEWKYYRENHQ